MQILPNFAEYVKFYEIMELTYILLDFMDKNLCNYKFPYSYSPRGLFCYFLIEICIEFYFP